MRRSFSISQYGLCGFVVALAVVSLFAPPAHAYLDPASAGMIVQVVVGMIVGIGLAVKVFWRRIARVFRRILGIKQVESEAEPSKEQP